MTVWQIGLRLLSCVQICYCSGINGTEEGTEIVAVTQKLLDIITSGDYEAYK